MDSPWCPVSRSAPERRFVVVMMVFVTVFVTLLWNLSGPQSLGNSQREGTGREPSGPVWTLVVTGSEADLLWQGRGCAELSPSEPFASSRATEVAWPTPGQTSVVAEFQRMISNLANAGRTAASP